ncbi:hypothetical protein CC80DRAFT_416916, partial [Byssothecium circinans]
EVLPFRMDLTEYTGQKVLAVPRCCQLKKGMQDRGRTNNLAVERGREIHEMFARVTAMSAKTLRHFAGYS